MEGGLGGEKTTLLGDGYLPVATTYCVATDDATTTLLTRRRISPIFLQNETPIQTWGVVLLLT